MTSHDVVWLFVGLGMVAWVGLLIWVWRSLKRDDEQ